MQDAVPENRNSCCRAVKDDLVSWTCDPDAKGMRASIKVVESDDAAA